MQSSYFKVCMQVFIEKHCP